MLPSFCLKLDSILKCLIPGHFDEGECAVEAGFYTAVRRNNVSGIIKMLILGRPQLPDGSLH